MGCNLGPGWSPAEPHFAISQGVVSTSMCPRKYPAIRRETRTRPQFVCSRVPYNSVHATEFTRQSSHVASGIEDRYAATIVAVQRMVDAKLAGRTLIATSRSNRVSRARYTSPMPPAPSGDTIS